MADTATREIGLFKHSKEFTAHLAGTVIFRDGEAGDAMYAVRSGSVELKIGDRVVETVGAGGIFGEMALIDAGPRSATAVTTVESEIVRVDEKQFNFLVQQTPFFALQVMRILAARLRQANVEAGRA